MGFELESEDPSSSGGDGYIPIKSYRNKYDLENINGRWSFSSFSSFIFCRVAEQQLVRRISLF